MNKEPAVEAYMQQRVYKLHINVYGNKYHFLTFLANRAVR